MQRPPVCGPGRLRRGCLSGGDQGPRWARDPRQMPGLQGCGQAQAGSGYSAATFHPVPLGGRPGYQGPAGLPQPTTPATLSRGCAGPPGSSQEGTGQPWLWLRLPCPVSAAHPPHQSADRVIVRGGGKPAPVPEPGAGNGKHLGGRARRHGVPHPPSRQLPFAISTFPGCTCTGRFPGRGWGCDPGGIRCHGRRSGFCERPGRPTPQSSGRVPALSEFGFGPCGRTGAPA